MFKKFKRKQHKHHLKIENRIERGSQPGSLLIFKCQKKRCKEEMAFQSYRVHQVATGSPYRESDRVY